MSQFRIGQRVRIVKSATGEHTGKEAIVLSPLKIWNPIGGGTMEAHAIEVIGVGAIGRSGLPLISPPGWLAPLTDPGTERDAAAERFIESLKRLGKEPSPIPHKLLSSIKGGA